MYIHVLTIHTTSGSASLHVSKFTSKSSSLSRLLVYMWGTQPQGLDVRLPIDYCGSYVNEWFISWINPIQNGFLCDYHIHYFS